MEDDLREGLSPRRARFEALGDFEVYRCGRSGDSYCPTRVTGPLFRFPWPLPSRIAATVTKKTKAIVPVNVFGQMAQAEQVQAAAPGIPVIEDAAQSIGAAGRSSASERRPVRP